MFARRKSPLMEREPRFEDIAISLMSVPKMPRAVIKECRERIYTMSLVHEQLYESNDFSKINFSDYVDTLANYITNSYQTDAVIDLQIDCEEIFLNISTAIPCGLILHEILSNAAKHAFQGKEKGTIAVRLETEDNNRCRLSVEDNGIGLPKDLDIDKADSLGLRLIYMLSKQVEGDIRYSADIGTAVSLVFPLEYE